MLCGKLSIMRRAKIFSVVLATCLFAQILSGQEKTSGPVASQPEAICGFLGKYISARPADVRRGLAVDMFVGDAKVNQPVTLRFYANQRPRNFPVDDLQVEHEKLMHVIGVSDDLSEFFHLHPGKIGEGMWALTHVFTNAGNYKFWVDVKYRGTSYAFEQPTLTVAGKIHPADKKMVPVDAAEVSGYRIKLRSQSPLRAGQTDRLEVSISNAQSNLVRTENFLGAPLHLVMVKDDLSVYLHAHTDSHNTTNPVISVTQTFPVAGRYKLFAQFRPMKSKLPRDEALLAEFCVDVLPVLSDAGNTPR